MILRGSTKTALGWALAILAGFSAAAQLNMNQKQQLKLSAVYDRAYYELCTGLERIQTDLDKLAVLPACAASDQLAADLWQNTNTVTGQLGTLPISQQYVQTLLRYTNQLGQYCMAMMRSGTVTDQNRADLDALSTVCTGLRESLSMIGENGEIPQSYWTMPPDKDGMLPLDGLSMQGMDYPTLRYDGPFADTETILKPLEGRTLTREEARKEAVDFVGQEQTDSCVSQSDGAGATPFYQFEISKKNGKTADLSVSKNGGHVLWMLCREKGENQILSVSEAVAAARQFLSEKHFGAMTMTGTQKQDGVLTVCFAAQQDEILLYPNMVKVQVSLEDGDIVGYDACAYWMHHRERVLGAIGFSRSQAYALVPELDVLSVQLCVIEMNGREYFCHEIKGRHEAQIYYVYADITDGTIRNVLLQIEEEDSVRTV